MKWRNHQILTPPTDDEVAEMTPSEFIELHKIYHEAIENAEKDPFRYGFKLPHWVKAEEAMEEVTEIVALGGNRSGTTPFSPPFGPASVSCNGPHLKSKILAIIHSSHAHSKA